MRTKETQQATKEPQQAARKTDLDRRETAVEGQETDPARKTLLDARKTALDNRETQLNNRERELNNRQQQQQQASTNFGDFSDTEITKMSHVIYELYDSRSRLTLRYLNTRFGGAGGSFPHHATLKLEDNKTKIIHVTPTLGAGKLILAHSQKQKWVGSSIGIMQTNPLL